MRYAQGGGLTAAARAKREQVRFAAAEMFAEGLSPPQVAQRLRVSRKSAYDWHQRWRAGGPEALASTVSAGWPMRLNAEQLDRLEKELQRGPVAHGWVEDQRWTLARMATVIKRLFGVDYTVKGVSLLLHRIGWSPQVPTHRAVERDEAAVAAWREETWLAVKKPRLTWAPGSSLKMNPASRLGHPRRAPGRSGAPPRW